jgi:hypothetical protein
MSSFSHEEGLVALCRLATTLKSSDEAAAIAALHEAARVGGADGAWFVWSAPASGADRLLRFMVALEHIETISGLQAVGEGLNQFLAHAARTPEPIQLASPAEPACGGSGHPSAQANTNDSPFRPAWLIPALGVQGSGIVGVLVLAASSTARLDSMSALLPAYRSLAMELGDWFHRQVRTELMHVAELTEQDLDLLRRENEGQCSKRIAQALHAEVSAIDCRFHRLNTRLGVSSRRDAVRLCARYGLL